MFLTAAVLPLLLRMRADNVAVVGGLFLVVAITRDSGLPCSD